MDSGGAGHRGKSAKGEDSVEVDLVLMRWCSGELGNQF